MTQQHPITPPPELIEQWMQDHTTKYDLARHAAQWGADQELEACCEWLKLEGHEHEHEALFAARRPKPPSLEEEALEDLDSLIADLANHGMGFKATNIRRALEQLDD